MPLAEKGVRGKGRSPCPRLSDELARARSALNAFSKIRSTLRRLSGSLIKAS
jgi:hypothetical protein